MSPWILALAVTAVTDVTAPVSQTEIDEISRALGADAAAAEPPPPPPPPPRPAAGGSAFNPELSFVGDFSAAYFSGEPAQAGAHDPAETGLAFRQLELGVRSNVDPYFRFEGFLVFTPEGVEVEEAVAATTSLPANLQLRAGRFFNRFGRINDRHPHAWAFIDAPLVTGKFFGPHPLAGAGLEPSVLLPLPWYAEIVGSVVQGGEDTLEAFAVEDPAVDRFDKLIRLAALKQFWSLGDDWGLSAGASGVQGPGPETGDQTTIVGLDAHLKFRPLSWGPDDTAVVLEGEWLGRRRDWAGARSHDSGGYAQLTYQMTRRWSAGVRAERLSAEGVVIDPHGEEEEELAAEDDGHGHAEGAAVPGDHARLREAAQITFSPTEFSQIRLQQNRDRIPGRDEPVWGTMLNLEIAIGAHGAHAY